LARTLLIGNPRTTWREWLREYRRGEDFLCLDPADPVQLTPTLLNLFGDGRPKLTRFYGSLDAQRQPHTILAFLGQALLQAEGDLLVQCFAFRPTPVMRQSVQLAAQMLQPDRILIASGTEIDQGGFPVGPEEITLDPALPPMVQHAQRKAQWLKLLEQCERHTVDLRKVSLEGSRLGSGRRLSEEERKKACLGQSVHAEVSGTSLFVVSDADFEEADVARALDFTGCTKAVFAEPGAYRNLLCSFANQQGEDFGFGIITEIDWRSLRAQVLNTSVPPAPVRLMRIGSQRVDAEGRELGEVRPWQV
jgi:hypothetical protein